MSEINSAAGRRRGFTIVELMVVIAITAILMSLLLSALSMAVMAAIDSMCRNNLHNIGRAVHVHHAELQYLPANGAEAPPSGWQPEPYQSVFYQLLPFCDQSPLTSMPYATAAAKPLFVCPMDPTSGGFVASSGYANAFATSSYVANGAIFVNARRSLSQAMPESSTTIIMSERLANCNCAYTAWADPAGSYSKLAQVDDLGQPVPGSALTGVTVQGAATHRTCIVNVPNQQSPPPTIFQSAHPGKVNVLRGDGQVGSIGIGYDPLLLNSELVGAGRDYWAQP